MSHGARVYGEYQNRSQDIPYQRSAKDVVASLASKDVREYSITRALQALFEDDKSKAPLEFEIHDALRRVAKKETALNNSILVPTELLMARDLTAANASGGGYLVGTNQGPVIDALRSRSAVMKLGATVLPGLNGDVPLPKIVTGATGYWITNEGAQTSESTATLGQIVLTPKVAAGFIEISRKLLLQSNADIIFRRDLTKMIAASIDAAAINGSGASGEPLGLINCTGVNAISGASLAWSGALDFIVNAGNANTDVTGFATTPAVYKLLSNREKFAGAGAIIYDGAIDARPIVHSTAVPAATLVAGPWEELWIGEWGVVELAADPFSKFTQRIVGLAARMTVDVGVRYPSAFSAATSIT